MKVRDFLFMDHPVGLHCVNNERDDEYSYTYITNTWKEMTLLLTCANYSYVLRAAF